MPRAPKKCARRTCTNRTIGRTYCPTCEAALEQTRASTKQRGYDHKHRVASEQARANLVPGTPCNRCHQPMWPGQQLHLDHTADRTTYRGLAHAHCNTSAPRHHPPTPPRQTT